MVENNLEKDSIRKLVLRLGIPSMLAQFINVLYSVVDRMYIGNIDQIGEIALAGVGICGPIVALLSAFGSFVGVGGSPLMSIRMGEKDEKSAKQILANSFLLLLVVSVVLTIILLPLKENLLLWFGASEQSFPYANDYFTIYLLGTVFALMSIGMNQFIICQGYAKVGMMSVMIGAVMNLVLDPVFIFVFGMGVKGAAIATVISQMVSCGFVLKFLFGKKVPIAISFGGYSLGIIRKISFLGLTPFIIIVMDNVLLIVDCYFMPDLYHHHVCDGSEFCQTFCSDIYPKRNIHSVCSKSHPGIYFRYHTTSNSVHLCGRIYRYGHCKNGTTIVYLQKDCVSWRSFPASPDI